MKITLGITLPALSLLFSSTSAAYHTKRNENHQGIIWKQCPAELAPAFPDGTECGSVAVPIDHDKPNNETITLRVFRQKATGSKTLGSLFFNLGGPGSAASDGFQAMKFVKVWGDSVSASYDIVGVDPRGIGYSHPILCGAAIYNQIPQMFASGDDDTAFARTVSNNKALGESCAKMTGPLAGFMDTVSTARDFEVVRQATGDGKFNYIGFSYGSFLGQTYAELFPDKVGRMVLDGILDHSSAWTAGIMTESSTYQATLEQFFTWCDENTTCALQGRDTRAVFARLTGPDASTPAACNGTCRSPVTGEDILINGQFMLGSVEPFPPFYGGWAAFSTSLDKADKGDAADFATLLANPAVNGTLLPTADTARYASRAVLCADFGSQLTAAADVRRIRDVAGALLPLTRGVSTSLAYTVYCAGWPAPVRDRPRRLDAGRLRRTSPVLIVNSLWDPETSAVWAAGVREQWPGAVSLWRNGSGHTSYFLKGETSQAMDAFLVGGATPADQTVLMS